MISSELWPAREMASGPRDRDVEMRSRRANSRFQAPKASLLNQPILEFIDFSLSETGKPRRLRSVYQCRWTSTYTSSVSSVEKDWRWNYSGKVSAYILPRNTFFFFSNQTSSIQVSTHCLKSTWAIGCYRSILLAK
jgi:hypothetical protein